MNANISDDAKSRLAAQFSALDIPAKVVDEIVTHHTLVNYDKGAMLFLQGSPADPLFWVFSGWVKVYCPVVDGTRIMVKLAGPSDLLGYIDYVDNRGRKVQAFEAQALTKCSVVLFTREQVMKLQQSLDHATLLALIERLNTAWSATVEWFGTFLAMSYKERLGMILRELAEKFGVHDARGTLLMPELTHPDLADMIGSSRPMVTRLLREMIEEGLVCRQGKQYVLLGTIDSATPDLPPQRGELKGLAGSPSMLSVRSAGRLVSKIADGGANRKPSPQLLNTSKPGRTSKKLRI